MKHASFADLGVSEAVVTELASMGIEKPFAVQSMVIPDVLEGHDVLAQSPTGSGDPTRSTSWYADRSKRPRSPVTVAMRDTGTPSTRISV